MARANVRSAFFGLPNFADLQPCTRPCTLQPRGRKGLSPCTSWTFGDEQRPSSAGLIVHPWLQRLLGWCWRLPVQSLLC